MGNLRKHVLVTAGILSALVIAESALRLLDEHLPPASHWPTIETQVKYDRLRDLTDADVVFLGSSMTEAAVDPAEFVAQSGFASAFNSGIPFSTPFSNEFWLSHVVLENVSPELVVIGLPAWSGGTGKAGDLLLTGFEEALEHEGSPRLALQQHAGLLSEWDTRNASLKVARLLTDLGHQTGYYLRSIEDSSVQALVIGPPQMPEDEAGAVARMIDQLAAMRIDVVVLIEPGRQPGDDGTVDYDRYIASILEYANEWDVPVLDTFHMDWDSSWFADMAHFNRRGTEVYTAYLANELARLTVAR